ncbi:MAG: murein biosynthesis integral membrane protein MurJ [Chloroflexi bacterium HGW-Chloroflexi-10]|nr:MAG: murein biosynthesis integral membrane protein MurJ [Chloroflexi bacterium HGW-Chloroflexi-10]
MTSDSNKTSSGRTGAIARSTVIISAGWAASIVVGLLRQRIVAGQFGTGAELDAFTAANVIPELIYTMLSGGALSFAFIPVYKERLEKGEGAAQLFSKVVNWIFLVTLTLSMAAALLAPWLVSGAWGVGAQYSAAVQSSIVQLMRILLFSTIIFSISSILTSTLYAHEHFVTPALLPSLYSAGIIFGALVLTPSMGVFGIAWGAVLGALLHFLIQIPAIWYYKVRWVPQFALDPALRRVAILMLPRILDLLMARASINWLNATLSSRLGEGRLAALDFAFRLMNMPWTLIGTAIGIAVFPVMAALAAQKDVSAQRKALSGSLRAILTLAIPAAAALFLLGEPIIRILFEGGEFTPESTQLVYYALRFYVLALISQSMLEVVVRAFAAQQDTYTPLYISIFTTLLNIGLAIWLTRPIEQGGISHGGPALANGLAVLVEASIGLTILSIRWKGVDLRRILLDLGKALVGSAVMVLVVMAARQFLPAADLIQLVVGGGAALLAYLVVVYFLGTKEIVEIPLAMIKRKRRSKAE